MFDRFSGMWKKDIHVQFETSDAVDFYVIGKGGIIGYSIEDEQLKEETKTEVGTMETSINPEVHRAELSNRYLVFSEVEWPDQGDSAVISIDFENGLVHRYPTNHCAYTSSGVSDSYYFASAVGEDSFLSVYTPELEEIYCFKPEPDMLLSDFVSSSNVIYTIGTEVEETELENGESCSKDYLVSISQQEGKFSVDPIKELKFDEEKQYYFCDLIVKGDYLYAVVGYRDLQSLEEVDRGAIYCYDLKNGTDELYELEGTDPLNIYDLGDGFLAIDQNSSESQKLGFTLFDYETLESRFVDLSSYRIDQEERGFDIKRLDLNHILVLTDHQLLIYDLQKGKVTFQSQCDESIEDPFHIWINQKG